MWCAWSGGGEDGGGALSGDPGTLAELAELADGDAKVCLTPTGPYRDVRSVDDELGVYLLAVQSVIPGPHDIIGSPPWEDTPGAEIPEGAVA